MTKDAQGGDPSALPNHPSDALVVYADRCTLVRMVFVGFVCCPVVALITVKLSPVASGSPFSLVAIRDLIVILGLLLFTGGALRAGVLLVSSRPLLVISHEGIWVSRLLFGVGAMGWADIRALIVVRYRWSWQRVFRIVLVDARPLRAKLTPMQWVFGLALQVALIRSGEVVVSEQMMSTSTSVLLQELRHRYGPEVAHHRIEVHDYTRSRHTSRNH